MTGPALADARLTVLVDVLKLPEAAQILREEGLSHATELDVDMLGGRGGPGWDIQIGAIYDTARMVETVRRALESELQEPDLSAELEQTIDFFASELGSKIVSLENSARAAILDDDVEEAARARYMALEGTDDARLELIRGFVESGDMINRNVTSAMNSNYQFLRGLTDGRATQMSDEEILADVAEDLDEITDDTVSWLYGYLLLAYHPLSDAELQAYLTYSQTKAGQALNRGLFDGFGKAYEDISYALGRAVALNMTAEEL
ncbi:hypothetical protein C1J02_11400 [Sulfitobacter sp. SK011]|nr:hypothetical protein C1J02_11400 [Sulfitobacter sp. SK011]